MGVAEYREHYTKDDYRNWDGDWELIYGSAYAMAPSPLFTHQYVNGKIFRNLDEAVDDCPDCYAVIETDWEVSDDTVVRPDSMLICYEPGEHLSKRPEMIFEVISTSTSKRDEILKFELYQNEGVSFYTIVYPDLKKSKVYKLQDYKYRKVGDFGYEKYTFELEKCDIEFDFSKIWRR